MAGVPGVKEAKAAMAMMPDISKPRTVQGDAGGGGRRAIGVRVHAEGDGRFREDGPGRDEALSQRSGSVTIGWRALSACHLDAGFTGFRPAPGVSGGCSSRLTSAQGPKHLSAISGGCREQHMQVVPRTPMGMHAVNESKSKTTIR